MLEEIQNEIRYAYPGMIAVVTTNYNGKTNAMASGWHTYIGSQPSLYGISLRKETYTYELVKKTKKFAINFLPAQYSEFIQAIGTRSGREMNKFKAFDISFELGKLTNAPILTDAYFAYECEIYNEVELGDHQWIAGKIVKCYMNQDVFLDNGLLDFSKIHIPLYTGKSNYRVLTEDAEEHHHAFYHKED